MISSSLSRSVRSFSTQEGEVCLRGPPRFQRFRFTNSRRWNPPPSLEARWMLNHSRNGTSPIDPTLPNFFIVGAPKAGTTSLCYYVGQHPDVYMSPIKEPSYFA